MLLRILLLILGGFALTLTTFASGVFAAIVYLTAEPVPDRGPSTDTAALWSSVPVRVNASDQSYKRVAGHSVEPAPADPVKPQLQMAETEATADAVEMVDTMTTGSVVPEAAAKPAPALILNDRHVEWCSDRYRSYRVDSNSYTAYSGDRRECISPFYQEASVRDEGNYVAAAVDSPHVGYAMEDSVQSDYPVDEHIRSCFDRYRSYRIEDNTYQPYGGGPRRQCR